MLPFILVPLKNTSFPRGIVMKIFPPFLILAMLSAGCASTPAKNSAYFKADLRYATVGGSTALETNPAYAVVEVTSHFHYSRNEEAVRLDNYQRALHVLDSISRHVVEGQGGEKGCPSSPTPTQYFSTIHVLSYNLIQSSEEIPETLVIVYGIEREEWRRRLDTWISMCVHG